MTESEHFTAGEPEYLSTEPFDLRNPEHAELTPPEDYHLQRGESIREPFVPRVPELPEGLDG